MHHLDGNAIAGQLADLFAFDPTTASARCIGCGQVAMLATAMVYMDAMGTVVRCASCGGVLATIVESDDRVWISLAGITALEISR